MNFHQVFWVFCLIYKQDVLSFKDKVKVHFQNNWYLTKNIQSGKVTQVPHIQFQNDWYLTKATQSGNVTQVPTFTSKTTDIGWSDARSGFTQKLIVT